MTDRAPDTDPSDRLDELRALLLEANRNYYELDAPTVPDATYDGWMREARDIETTYPELDSPRCGSSG